MWIDVRLIGVAIGLTCPVVLASGACTVFSKDEVSSVVGAGGESSAPDDGKGIPKRDDVGGVSGDQTCGDGRVSGSETCDIGIELGKKGACLPCPDLGPCYNVEPQGTGCHFACMVTSIECINGDGCCPQGCNSLTDNDCSDRCGDGIIQKEKNETCEPAGALDADPKTVCPSKCNTGSDPCVVEWLSGSVQTCNSSCKRTTITQKFTGDGCCPKGATADQDGDCESVCGNGILEGNEECDSVSSCDPQCRWQLTAEQIECMNTLSEDEHTCGLCMCTKCTASLLACRATTSPDMNANCTAITHCGFRTGCGDIACYCGENNSDSALGCLTDAAGPCKEVIETAAGTPNSAAIALQWVNPATAVSRALNVGNCLIANCSDSCKL